MWGVLCHLARAPPEWLVAAGGSLAVCGAVFITGPKLVPRLLRRQGRMEFKDEKDEASSGGRYVAFVHAVTAAAFNTYILTATDTFDDSPGSANTVPLMWRTSRLSSTSLGISLGYFLLDATLVARYMPAMGGVEMVAHHISAFASIAATLRYGEAHMYTLALLATEWTTPFINFRWLLERMGLKDSRLYMANGAALLLSWSVVRVGLFGWLAGHMWHRRDQIWRAHWPVRLLLLSVPSLLGCLNLMWYEKIVRGCWKAFFQRGPRAPPRTPERRPQNGAKGSPAANGLPAPEQQKKAA